MFYNVYKEKGGRYYVCGEDKEPIPGTFKKDKKDAMRIAAKYSDIPYKEYVKMRKQLLNAC